MIIFANICHTVSSRNYLWTKCFKIVKISQQMLK